MAVAALIFGILIPPVGIVLAIVALSTMGKRNQAGKGLAIAGLILGILGTLAVAAVAIGIALGVRTVDSLNPGDCVAELEEGGTVSLLRTVNCDSSHAGEVFATFELPDGPFPGSDAVRADASAGCVERFGGYVGVDYFDSRLEVFTIAPREERVWDETRRVTCLVVEPDLSPMVGSVRNSGQ
jgi:hypothetical protein